MTLSLDVLLHWLELYKYLVLFPIVVVEGPIISVLAGFLASQGYLSLIVTLIVVVVADVTSDCLYYSFGRCGGRRIVNRYGRYIGLKPERLEGLEERFRKKARRTLILGKLTHGLGVGVLVAAGLAKVPFGEFLLYDFIPTVPKSLAFILIGYFFGAAYKQIDQSITVATYALGVLGLMCIGVWWLRRHWLQKKSKVQL